MNGTTLLTVTFADGSTDQFVGSDDPVDLYEAARDNPHIKTFSLVTLQAHIMADEL